MTSDRAGIHVGTVPPKRQAKCDAAREAWIKKLVDLSRRNNLLFFRDLQVGTLDISNATDEALRTLLQSGRVPDDGLWLDDLCKSPSRATIDLDQASRSLKEIAARAESNREEKGLDTLFLAVGMAEWQAGDGGRDTSAPILLVPLRVSNKGGRSVRWWLRRNGDVQVNHVLTHALEVEHKVLQSPEALLARVQGDDEGEQLNLEPVFQALREAASNVPGFRVASRWIIGNFAFQKLAIVKDLREHADAVARHDLVAGIAGDEEAAASSRASRTTVDPREFDRQSPDCEYLVLDADSSQHQAIAAALAGHNGVISGPPGTGKSQTIANLIAELVAKGKTVLFVAEKRAALDVVKDRLSEVGLDHLCLDCHGAEGSRRLIALQIQESLQAVRNAPPVDIAAQHAKLVDRRQRLNNHVTALHMPRFASGLSLYQMYGSLLHLERLSGYSVRLSRDNLVAMTPEHLEGSCELLREAGSHASLLTGESSSAWCGARFQTQDQARLAMQRVDRLANGPWHECYGALRQALQEMALLRPTTVADLESLVAFLGDLKDLLSSCSTAVFDRSPGELAKTLAPAAQPLLAAWAFVFNSDFRRAVRAVRAVGTLPKIPARRALELAQRADELLRKWQSTAEPETLPRWSVGCDRLLTNWAGVAEDLHQLLASFPDRQRNTVALDAVDPWLRGLTADRTSALALVRLGEIEREIVQKGLGAIWEVLKTRRPDPSDWPDLLRSAFLTSAIDETYLADPRLATFDGRYHDQIAHEFRSLDAARLRLAVDRVRRTHAEAAVAVRNRFPTQDAIVLRESQKRTRHMPLRRLFTEAPDVLLGLRPCWMASPLSVSQLIPGDRPYFDVVIFDEASQVLPEDAVTSLLRGRQAIVAGDRRQLPPTSFFAAAEIDTDAEIAGFESILDVMSAFLDPAWSLDWHYRSRDETLIAYSNHRIYDGRLVTFPGPGTIKAIHHELVHHEAGAGQEQSASPEVRRVVEVILDHAEKRPDESLGVITMGIAHARRIEMALDRERQAHPELDAFFGSENREKFFIKNLERVQGDERDAIILSVGYGKNEAGKLVYRFGPLLQQGGERRLNVAITRARQRMTVVSSFSHLDMDPDYPKDGVRHLRAYLEYAASGGRRLGHDITPVPLNDFEQSVMDALVAKGLKVIGQVGSSKYRIDLAVMHPDQPGRFVLAIECDGASYHSAPSARDRDRLRQQQLEALNWRFCRIWSTDWFLRREDELKRVLKAVEDAIRIADSEDDGPAVIPTPSLEVREAALPASIRPRLPPASPGLPIHRYSSRSLQAVVQWVQSDGILRTDEEIAEQVRIALGFQRRGARILEAINDAVRAVKESTQARGGPW